MQYTLAGMSRKEKAKVDDCKELDASFFLTWLTCRDDQEQTPFDIAWYVYSWYTISISLVFAPYFALFVSDIMCLNQYQYLLSSPPTSLSSTLSLAPNFTALTLYLSLLLSLNSSLISFQSKRGHDSVVELLVQSGSMQNTDPSSSSQDNSNSLSDSEHFDFAKASKLHSQDSENRESSRVRKKMACGGISAPDIIVPSFIQGVCVGAENVDIILTLSRTLFLTLLLLSYSLILLTLSISLNHSYLSLFHTLSLLFILTLFHSCVYTETNSITSTPILPKLLPIEGAVMGGQISTVSIYIQCCCLF